MLYSIHRFPESFVRDRLQLKLKDEEAEIELIGSRLEEEANVAEIEEVYGDARIWLPNIDGFCPGGIVLPKRSLW